VSEAIDPAPPPGWVLATNRGPFTTHNGPLYRFDEGDVWRRGFRALPRHCNGFGLIHGGWYMAFVDGVLGEAVGRATGVPSLTVRLTSDFLHSARAGDWIEGTARCTRATRTLAFAEAELHSANRLLFTATGVFKLMEGHAARRRAAAAYRLGTAPAAK
jgi:acyl-coenzyme A thioesterase PaaI-like protein